MQLRDLLTGGDRRSIARANEALTIALDDREAVAELARLTADPDWLVAQRACDVLEKLLRQRPEWVQPHKHAFLKMLASPYWETRLQCVRALPLFNWNEEEKVVAIEALRERIDDEQKFVCCWALDGFASLAYGRAEYRAELDKRLSEFLGSEFPSMRARAKAIARRLSA